MQCFSAYNLLSVPAAICRSSRSVADHNAACTSSYSAIARRIAKDRDSVDAAADNDAAADAPTTLSSSSSSALFAAQAYAIPQFPGYGAAGDDVSNI